MSFIKNNSRIFVDRDQQNHLIVSVSHDNSINRDNRIFIILWDFILIFSGSLCCRYCALVQRCVSPTGSWTSRSTRLNSWRDIAVDWNIDPFLVIHFHEISLSRSLNTSKCNSNAISKPALSLYPSFSLYKGFIFLREIFFKKTSLMFYPPVFLISLEIQIPSCENLSARWLGKTIFARLNRAWPTSLTIVGPINERHSPHLG